MMLMKSRGHMVVALGIVAALAIGVGVVASSGATGRDWPAVPDNELQASIESVASSITWGEVSSSDDFPKSGDVVLSTRQSALNLVDGGVVDTDQPVYLVQVTGKFVSSGPIPPGVDAPTGTVLWILYDPATGLPLDRGLGHDTVDLAKLGEVSQIELSPIISPTPADSVT